MKWIKVVALLSLLITGCNGVRLNVDSALSDYYFLIFSGFPTIGLAATAVQWNEDYAVTVAHLPNVNNKVYTCSTECDLVFIRHKANGKIPQWRDFKVGEAVKTAGSSSLYPSVSSDGKVYSAPFIKAEERGAERYAIHDAAIVKGMSGGPVVGQDGKIVGFNLGIGPKALTDLGHPELRGAKRISVFMPYEIIEREWQIFQRQQVRSASVTSEPRT